MLPRLVAAAVFTSFLVACGPSPTTRPDGGGIALCSQEEETFLAVAVKDAEGAPVDGATVVGKNLGSGKQVTGTTNEQGVTTSIGSSLGSGSIEVRAKLNTRVSEPKQVEFLCGECGCDINPESITLTVPL
jgi:hypothetical protein